MSAASKFTDSPVPTATPTSATAKAAESLNPSPTIIVTWLFDLSSTHWTLSSGDNEPKANCSGSPTLLANAVTDDC